MPADRRKSATTRFEAPAVTSVTLWMSGSKAMVDALDRLVVEPEQPTRRSARRRDQEP